MNKAEPSKNICPKCGHPHLDYTDEACVSCGCDYEKPIFELTGDELKFLQACYNDSCNEGCFDGIFKEIDFESVEASLIEKGVLREQP